MANLTNLWRVTAMLALFVLVLAPALARDTAPLLNSERIELMFGSYGIEVLQQATAEQPRVSDLYSGIGADRITRTLAIVSLPAHVGGTLAGPHAEIKAGGSIGAVLKAAGWQVTKQHYFIGEIDANPEWTGLWARMATRPETLAVNIYHLYAQKPGERWPYALIVEIYHPDYLELSDLEDSIETVSRGKFTADLTPRILSVSRRELAALEPPDS